MQSADAGLRLAAHHGSDRPHDESAQAGSLEYSPLHLITLDGIKKRLEIPFTEMREMVKDGRIVDAKTVMLSLFLEKELGLPPL